MWYTILLDSTIVMRWNEVYEIVAVSHYIMTSTQINDLVGGAK